MSPKTTLGVKQIFSTEISGLMTFTSQAEPTSSVLPLLTTAVFENVPGLVVLKLTINETTSPAGKTSLKVQTGLELTI